MSEQKGLLVFVPMYNCAPQIGRVLAQFTPSVTSHVGRLLVIDNCSTDGGAEVAKTHVERIAGVETVLVRNRENYGLGGSHKVGFAYALRYGYERVAVLHGDDQGAIADLIGPLASGEAAGQEAFLGARFMSGSRLEGYSRFRTLGNRAFNRAFSLAAGKRIYDLGSGLNLYRTDILRDGFFTRFPDDLTFNYCMVLAHAYYRHRIRFFPISWREDDQISNVRLFRQARKVLRLLGSFVRNRDQFVTAELRTKPIAEYAYDVVATNREAARP